MITNFSRTFLGINSYTTFFVFLLVLITTENLIETDETLLRSINETNSHGIIYRKFEGFNIKQMTEFVQSLKARSSEGDKEEQKKCIGIALPASCISVKHNHSVQCLMDLWEESNCGPNGYKAPSNLTNDEIEVLSQTKLVQIKQQFDEVNEKAESGDEIMLPACKSYHGPLSLECINNIWRSVGCKTNGTDNPELLPGYNFTEIYGKFNQLTATLHIANLKELASMGETRYGLKCFGTPMERGCTFDPPLSVQCYTKIWLEVVQCSRRGRGFPERLNSTYLESLYGGLNYKEATEKMFEKKRDNIFCYGFDFPDRCQFRPPLGTGCMSLLEYREMKRRFYRFWDSDDGD